MEDRISKRYRVYGIVQGVGFRPFVARIAAEAGISGSVCNKGPYVEIFAEGMAGQVSQFRRALEESAPPRSAILKVEEKELGAGHAAEAGTKGREKGDLSYFHIIESEKVTGDIFVSPDIATCPRCRKELFDPGDRRYLHPFINCTACGPRVTILDSMPYDRIRTSMGQFPMCPDCEYEYRHPQTRRYHAQPVCCNDCGPSLYILNPDESRGQRDGDALIRTREVIREGGIAAIKGIGGFHLCCDGTNQEAVMRLRRLKNRPFKPFATMLRDLETVRRECMLNPKQEEILEGAKKPILLLERRSSEAERSQAEGPRICGAVAPDNPNIGVMLPYAPVQMLLFDYPDGSPMTDCLVMTSANPKGAPICKDDEDVLANITDYCDIILTNDRMIRLRADDSVIAWQPGPEHNAGEKGGSGNESSSRREHDADPEHDPRAKSGTHAPDLSQGRPYMIRRSRGYAPLPVMMGDGFPQAGQVLGIGGELKSTFCLSKGPLFYPSPYIGDLTDLRSVDALHASIVRMERLLEIEPQAICCDLHPGYNSTALARQLAEERGIPLFQVQHHYAHILSCMAENDWHEPVIGVSFDGTGYGSDGTIWGGEFLIADERDFRRAGSIGHFAQAGGDLASREGWRIAASLIGEAFDGENSQSSLTGADIWEKLNVTNRSAYVMIQGMTRGQINTVRSTSAGRLFDAVSSILGYRNYSTCEGEASMVLQYAAERGGKMTGPTDVLADITLKERDAGDEQERIFEVPLTEMISALVEHRLEGQETDRLAYQFHHWTAEAIAAGCEECRRQSGIDTVCLSGGVMQNILLLGLAAEGLRKRGFRVLTHSLIPANDGGICLGQAVYASLRAGNEG